MSTPNAGPSSAGSLLLDHIGPMRVINLPHRTDRRREFVASMASAGLSIDDPRVEWFPAIRPDSFEGFPSIGARGCFLSHLQILRDAESKGLGGVVVCEDDLDFCSTLPNRVLSLLRGLDALPWQMVYAGHAGLPDDLQPHSDSGLWQLDKDIKVRGTHFLMYRQEVFGQLISYLEAMLARRPGDPAGGPMHFDGALNHFRRDHPELIVLAAIPALGHQRPSRTDIHQLSFMDRCPGLRNLSDLARRAKRWFAR